MSRDAKHAAQGQRPASTPVHGRRAKTERRPRGVEPWAVDAEPNGQAQHMPWPMHRAGAHRAVPVAGLSSARLHAERHKRTCSPLIGDPAPRHATGLGQTPFGIGPALGFGAERDRPWRRQAQRNETSKGLEEALSNERDSLRSRKCGLRADFGSGTAPRSWAVGSARWVQPTDPITHMTRQNEPLPPETQGARRHFPPAPNGVTDPITHRVVDATEAQGLGKGRGLFFPEPLEPCWAPLVADSKAPVSISGAAADGLPLESSRYRGATPIRCRSTPSVAGSHLSDAVSPQALEGGWQGPSPATGKAPLAAWHAAGAGPGAQHAAGSESPRSGCSMQGHSEQPLCSRSSAASSCAAPSARGLTPPLAPRRRASSSASSTCSTASRRRGPRGPFKFAPERRWDGAVYL